jgi:hypothetical protein
MELMFFFLYEDKFLPHWALKDEGALEREAAGCLVIQEGDLNSKPGYDL